MNAVRFPLDSEQCELLAAFEVAPSLAALARSMGREVSVVSRQIKRLAETAPVLEKRGGRWVITPLGRQLASWSRDAVATMRQLVERDGLRLAASRSAAFADDAALVLVNCQRGFVDPVWGTRNNHDAEANVARLLLAARDEGRTVVHVRHRSRERDSPLRPGAIGHAFLPALAPCADEVVIDKSSASAFVGTDLGEQLRARGIATVVVVGFTLNHCVDATIRSAADLGFDVVLVADATVSFSRVGPSGDTIAADVLHAASLACLSQEFAIVAETGELLGRRE